MQTNFQHRKKTAHKIGLEFSALPLLVEMYYHDRISYDLNLAAYLLNDYRDSRSDFMRNHYIKMMEKEYYTLYY